MNAEKLAIITRKAALFDWLAAKGSFSVQMGWEEGEPVQFFQTFGNVNDRETEKTGEGEDLASAIESAIAAENKRRAVISATEIADALHAARSREKFSLAVMAKRPGRRKAEKWFVNIEADDRADALKQIRAGYIRDALSPFVGPNAGFYYDARKLRRG